MNIEPIKPQSGQESVWAYPRPPRLEAITDHIRVVFNGMVIVDTSHAFRVLETSHPPVYYLPPTAIQMQYLKTNPQGSFCEWKGQAAYYDVQVGDKLAAQAAWYYPDPVKSFEPFRDHVAFYAFKMDACYVNDELVTPQPGNFYGGWITSKVVGPFKGEPGSWGW